MKTRSKKFALSLLVALAYGPGQALAVPILGSNLATFAVLGESTVTNVPTSTINGSVGVSAGTELPGFNFVSGLATADPQVTGGQVHSNTAVAAAGQAELTTARTNLTSLGLGTALPVDLSGLTLLPGVYSVAAGTTNLSGTLTLDGLGNANAFWLFQMASTLITSPGSVVNVLNAGSGAGLFWNVGSSATLDTTTSFQGNILALTAITLNTGATIGCGRALADNAAVTLDHNTISLGCLGTGEEGSNGLSGGGLVFTGGGTVGTVVIGPGLPGAGTVVSVPGTRVPEPGTLALLALGLIGLRVCRRFGARAAA